MREFEFQNSTPNNSNIWRQDIKSKSSGRNDLVGPSGKTARLLEGGIGSGRFYELYI
jgi:hypothetical protein